MLFNAIFLLGAIHGLVLALLLASKKVNQLSNRIMGALMLVFSIDLAMASYLGFGAYQDFPHAIGLDYPITLLYGPLLYLYSKTLINAQTRMTPKDWSHLSAFGLLLIFSIPFYLLTGQEKIDSISAEGGLMYGSAFITHIKLGYNLIYIAFILRLVRDYKNQLKNNFSSLDKRNLDWLQWFIFGIVVLALMATVLHYMSSVYGENVMYTNINLLGITIYVYSIGYMGLRQPEFFADFSTLSHSESVTDSKPAPSYSRSGLDEQSGKELMARLTEMMEDEKPYMNNELSLKDLSETAGISTHNLTEIINSYAGKNFYDFINSYRVEEVKKRIMEPGSDNLTMLALGLEAGFNSKSSFNSVFKKHTGMTPSEYKRSLN
ncbi:MAG: AraC family transcriptional regulator [Balneola sp.]|nr:MAG: AraC family transcriptional regulator [Balneola sp.]